jgi:hypothetical protein
MEFFSYSPLKMNYLSYDNDVKLKRRKYYCGWVEELLLESPATLNKARKKN